MTLVYSCLGYVDDIFNALSCSNLKDLADMHKQLKKDVPDPLHTMLDNKQGKDEAIEKFISSKVKASAIVPPTHSGMYRYIYIYVYTVS